MLLFEILKRQAGICGPVRDNTLAELSLEFEGNLKSGSIKNASSKRL